MVRLTLGTVPFSDTQRQRLLNVTAIPTAFRAREPSVNLDKSTTVPLALIFEQGLRYSALLLRMSVERT